MARDTYAEVMSGRKDNNIRFADLQRLLRKMRFSYRTKGDHFIYWRDDIPEIINVQPLGSMVKVVSGETNPVSF